MLSVGFPSSLTPYVCYVASMVSASSQAHEAIATAASKRIVRSRNGNEENNSVESKVEKKIIYTQNECSI